MKKFFTILLFLVFVCEIGFAKNYNKGDIVSGTFEPGKRLKIQLSPGKWQVVYKSAEQPADLRSKSPIMRKEGAANI